MADQESPPAKQRQRTSKAAGTATTRKTAAKKSSPRVTGERKTAPKKSAAKKSAPKKRVSPKSSRRSPAPPRLLGLRILIVRHAKAEDRERFAQTGLDDDLRPLTDPGRKRMRKVAKGLRELVPGIDRLVTSPYTRAVETAEVLSAVLKVGEPIEHASLTPEAAPQAVMDWLLDEAGLSDGQTVVLVGHDPHLPRLATWLIGGKDGANFQFKKGGACLIEFPEGLAPGRGVLQWLLTSAQLRDLAD